MTMTIDEVRAHVADGNRWASLMGTYSTPSGNAIVSVEKDGPGWGVVEMKLTVAGKSAVVSPDLVEHNINRGTMTKIN